MKLLMIATALLVLSGCERAAEVEQQSRLKEQQVTTPELTKENFGRGLNLITDHVTGCQYIGYWHAYVTPRLNADGTQMCRKAVEL